MLEKLPETLGQLLGSARAGLENLLVNSIDLREGTARIRLTSSAFRDHAPIPPTYTADGEGLSPPLEWSDVPPATKSLALIVEDADSPTPAPLVHAIAVDIDPLRRKLLEDELRVQTSEEGGNTALQLGRNSYLRQAWLPPDPPPGHGVHRYAFQLFALADGEPFSDSPGRQELVDALRERAIASGWLIGTYSRDNRIKIESESSEPAALPLASDIAPA